MAVGTVVAVAVGVGVKEGPAVGEGVLVFAGGTTFSVQLPAVTGIGWALESERITLCKVRVDAPSDVPVIVDAASTPLPFLPGVRV